VVVEGVKFSHFLLLRRNLCFSNAMAHSNMIAPPNISCGRLHQLMPLTILTRKLPTFLIVYISARSASFLLAFSDFGKNRCMQLSPLKNGNA